MNRDLSIEGKIFNAFSHFMGTNPLVQFVLQPILIAGVLFHFILGFVLDWQNRKSRPVKYVSYKGSANANFTSRNMIISGIVVLSFMGLHFYDFWVPEMKYKYIDVLPENPERYFEELVHKFEDPVRVGIYCLSFVFLALHLVHGFASSFKSLGTDNKYAPTIKKISYAYGILIPLGFCFIAIFHYYSTL